MYHLLLIPLFWICSFFHTGKNCCPNSEQTFISIPSHPASPAKLVDGFQTVTIATLLYQARILLAHVPYVFFSLHTNHAANTHPFAPAFYFLNNFIQKLLFPFHTFT